MEKMEEIRVTVQVCGWYFHPLQAVGESIENIYVKFNGAGLRDRLISHPFEISGKIYRMNRVNSEDIKFNINICFWLK